MDSQGQNGIVASLPGTVKADFEQMGQPYGIYVNPYTGYIYGTDATSFEAAGYLYQWTPEGRLIGKHKVYVNPGHFLALPPDGHFLSVKEIPIHMPQSAYLNDLQGRRVTTPRHGSVYIQNGHIYIY